MLSSELPKNAHHPNPKGFLITGTSGASRLAGSKNLRFDREGTCWPWPCLCHRFSLFLHVGFSFGCSCTLLKNPYHSKRFLSTSTQNIYTILSRTDQVRRLKKYPICTPETFCARNFTTTATTTALAPETKAFGSIKTIHQRILH